MGLKRARVVLPQDLVEEIDSVVGLRRRSVFLVETARAELRRRRLLAILRDDRPIWKDEDHPELAGGASAWVRSLRSQSDSRISQTKTAMKPSR